MGTGEYTIHALPQLFLLVDTRADNYRAAAGGAGAGRVNKDKTRPRATNMAYLNALVRELGLGFECRPAGCWWSKHPVHARVGRPKLEELEPL